MVTRVKRREQNRNMKTEFYFSENFSDSNEECTLQLLYITVSIFILTSSARKCQYIEMLQLNFVDAVNFFMAEQCHCWQLG